MRVVPLGINIGAEVCTLKIKHNLEVAILVKLTQRPKELRIKKLHVVSSSIGNVYVNNVISMQKKVNSKVKKKYYTKQFFLC